MFGTITLMYDIVQIRTRNGRLKRPVEGLKENKYKLSYNMLLLNMMLFNQLN
jgi:hypothetical protein